jgi:hypothetical protein
MVMRRLLCAVLVAWLYAPIPVLGQGPIGEVQEDAEQSKAAAETGEKLACAEIGVALSIVDLLEQVVESAVCNVASDGTFGICDWTGYPRDIPRPDGPFRLVPEPEYTRLRNAANAANGKLQRTKLPNTEGWDIHEIKPVKFGGSPTDVANKVPLRRDLHRREVGPWWNKIQKEVERKLGKRPPPRCK